VVENVFSDEPSACWHVALGSRKNEVKDVLDLVNMDLRVLLDLHEFADKGEQSGVTYL